MKWFNPKHPLDHSAEPMSSEPAGLAYDAVAAALGDGSDILPAIPLNPPPVTGPFDIRTIAEPAPVDTLDRHRTIVGNMVAKLQDDLNRLGEEISERLDRFNIESEQRLDAFNEAQGADQEERTKVEKALRAYQKTLTELDTVDVPELEL